MYRIEEPPCIYWFKDEECTILHRTDGPAIENYPYSAWYFNGEFIGRNSAGDLIYLNQLVFRSYPILRELSDGNGFLTKSNFLKFVKLQAFI